MKRISYSQTGQDILAEFLLQRNGKIPREKGYVGTYVDVGACYPVRASNTFYFYERGWSGICIDANPATAKEFTARRPRDVFISEAVGDEPGILPFYTFDNPQWNCFDRSRMKKLRTRFTGQIDVPIRRLADMIASTGMTRKIDLLSIDTEGFELKVLRSLELGINRPSLIILECIKPLESAMDDPAIKYLTENGYRLASWTGHDAFMLEN
jgi:FkbM family methyltransferase